MTFQTPTAKAKAPGCAWYFLALLILVLGGAAAGILVLTQLPRLGEKLPQLVVPGETTLNLTEPGTYMIYHERESVVDGRVYSAENISGLRVTLRDARGAQVPLSAPGMSSTYNFSGRSGVAVYKFEIAQPGAYRLAAAYDGGRTQPRAVLAVGLGFVSGLLTIIFGALALAFGGAVIAVIVAVVVFVKRHKAKHTATVPDTRRPTVS